MVNGKRLDIALLILEILTVFASAYALCNICFDNCVHFFVDSNQPYYWSASLQPFTYQVSLLTGASFFFFIPYRIRKINNPNYVTRTPVKVLRFIVCVLEVFTFLTVVVTQVPLVLAEEKTWQGVYLRLFSEGQVSAHFIIPPLCFIYLLLNKREMVFKRKYIWFTLAPILVYVIEYLIFVFISKVWADFYRMMDVAKILTVPGFIVGLFAFVALVYGVAYLLYLFANPREKKQKTKKASEE